MNTSKPFKPYRAADYLQSPEEAAEYLNAAIEDGHPAVLLKALRNVADSTGGMSHLSRETGLTRESLYKALSEEGNPRQTLEPGCHPASNGIATQHPAVVS